jgi:cobaltochelatase CobN
MTLGAEFPLSTKRLFIGHLTICSGCCCGVVSRGKPEVPVEWLKQQWRARRLLKNLQLTISCCLGPCDLTNVVKVSGPDFEMWLGKISRFEQYSSLVDWAEQSEAAGALLPLPDDFNGLRFNPYHTAAK